MMCQVVEWLVVEEEIYVKIIGQEYILLEQYDNLSFILKSPTRRAPYICVPYFHIEFLLQSSNHPSK